MATVLAEHISRWPGVAAAGAFGRSGGRSGLLASAGPAGDVLAWASVTKLLVALCFMVALEEGTVRLDDDAGPAGSTVAHLLAHASGLPFEGQRPVAPPGRRRIYSNTGIEMAAAHLSSRAGMPFGEYLQAGVLGPLGMTGTHLRGSPAHGADGPLDDLVRLAAELLEPQLVSAPTLRQATSVAWPGLAGVVPGFGRFDPCDWGHGPELRGSKWPHWTGSHNSARTFGHFGQSGAFLWVDPDAGLALAGLSSEPFGPWAKQRWPALSDEILALGRRPG